MARSSSSASSSRRNTARMRNRTQWLPQGLTDFFMARMVDAYGIACAIGAVFLGTAIASYQPSDPSLNAVPDNISQIQNVTGIVGAYSADLIVQTIGLGVLPLLCVMAVRGYMIVRREESAWTIMPRFVLCVLAIIMLSGAFAAVSAPASWTPLAYMGGLLGAHVLSGVAAALHALAGDNAFLVATTLLSVIGVVCGALALGLRRDQWGTVGEYMAATTYALGEAAIKTTAALREWLQARSADNTEDDEEDARPARKRPGLRRAPAVEDDAEDEDETEEEEEDEEEEERRPLLRAIRASNDSKIAKPDKKKAEKARQKSLRLSTDDEDWDFPALEILQEDPEEDVEEELDERSLTRNAELLQQVLEDFNISGEIVKIHPGPVVTLYELEPAPGIKSSRVIGLCDDIARSMSALSVRAAVVPGRNVIGIEIPNKKRRTVYMRSLLASDKYLETPMKLPLVLGKDIGGEPIIADLTKMPHLLVAGTTGSGKSVAMNTMILSLLYKHSPEKCRFIMIDPKMLELSVYEDIPHLLAPVVTEPGKAVVALKWTVHEMEERYRAMSKLGVRNIDGYNVRIREAIQKGEVLTRKVQTGFDPETGKPIYEETPIELVELPYIVVVVDEFADLMLVAGKDVENAIQRLAQMARAAGIHLIMATQRPSVDVITGVIKANFPTRISFQVTSKIDSRTILGEGGAEQLLGMGDMLYMATGGRMQRVHGPFVADREVEEVATHLRAQSEPQYLEEVTAGGDEDSESGDMFGEGGGSSGDALYDQAVALVAREGKASTSFIQRHLQIGYNKAATIVERMEKEGVISPANRVGKREVLVGQR